METRDFTGLLSTKAFIKRKSNSYIKDEKHVDHDYRDIKKRPYGPEFNVLLKHYYGPELEKHANNFWTAALTMPGITKICVTVQINSDKAGLRDNSGTIFKTFWDTIYKCIAGLLTISPTLHHLEIVLHDDMCYKTLGRDDCTWDLFNSVLMNSVGCDWRGNSSIVSVNMIVWMSSKLIGLRTVIIPWIIIYGLRTPSLVKHCALSRTLRFIFPFAEIIDVGWSRHIPQNLVLAIIEEKYARGANPFIQ
jgi:hypothetical protein